MKRSNPATCVSQSQFGIRLAVCSRAFTEMEFLCRQSRSPNIYIYIFLTSTNVSAQQTYCVLCCGAHTMKCTIRALKVRANDFDGVLHFRFATIVTLWLRQTPITTHPNIYPPPHHSHICQTTICANKHNNTSLLRMAFPSAYAFNSQQFSSSLGKSNSLDKCDAHSHIYIFRIY